MLFCCCWAVCALAHFPLREHSQTNKIWYVHAIVWIQNEAFFGSLSISVLFISFASMDDLLLLFSPLNHIFLEGAWAYGMKYVRTEIYMVQLVLVLFAFGRMCNHCRCLFGLFRSFASRSMCTIYMGILGRSGYVVELVFILMAARGELLEENIEFNSCNSKKELIITQNRKK